MPELTPLDDNRQEHFLNGEDLEPITRREHFYAGRESELPAGHQEPETREEWFIQKYRGGGGDVTVVPLSVTENGTYSEEGKAYSPVSVNVPLPENAYLLKSVANLPQAIASFNDGEDMVMPTLKVAIEPQQDLHGYDSPWVGGAGKNKFPDNVDNTGSSYNCESVFTGNKLTLTGTSTGNGGRLSLKTKNFSLKAGTYYLKSFYKNTHSKATPTVFLQIDTDNVLAADEGTYTLEADTTVATLGANVANGQQYDFEATYALYNTDENTYYPYSNICPISGWDEVDVTVADATTDPTVENIYTIDLGGTRYGGTLDVVSGDGTDRLGYVDLGSLTWTNGGTDCVYVEIIDMEIDGFAISDKLVQVATGTAVRNMPNYSFKLYDDKEGIAVKYEGINPTNANELLSGFHLLYELATPTTYDTQPTAIKSLKGDNNVWADTGDIDKAEYFSKEV